MTRFDIMQILNKTLRVEVIGSMGIVAGQALACEELLKEIREAEKKRVIVCPYCQKVVGEFTTCKNENMGRCQGYKPKGKGG